MTGSFSDRLTDWFGETSPGADAATWQLVSAWDLPPWATVLLLAAIVLWTVSLYARESTSAGRRYRSVLVVLRLLALGALLVIIGQWAVSMRLTGAPRLALVIDRSASMGVVDHYDDTAFAAMLGDQLRRNELGEPTRINLAKLLALQNDGRLLEALAARYQLDVYLVAEEIQHVQHLDTPSNATALETIRELSTEGVGANSTRLGDAVLHVTDSARSTMPAGIIMLSDGITTEGVSLVDAAQQARRNGVPIFAVGLGRSDPPRDIEVADVLVDDFIFVDDLVRFEVHIRSTGFAGESARAILRRSDRSEPVAEQDITLSAAGETQTVALIDRPTAPGEIEYHIEVLPRDDEKNTENNHQRRVVTVRDEKIRVLAAFAYPSYEFRFLKSLLERDRTVELATYLQDADPDYAEQDKSALRALPMSRDELSNYDVLILGDLNPELVPNSFWENVRAFVVEQAGGAAFIAGPRYFPWRYENNVVVSALLPFELDFIETSSTANVSANVIPGFVVKPSPIGLRSPALQLGGSTNENARIWQDLAPLYWLATIGAPKPGAQVLAVGPPSGMPGVPRAAESAAPAILFQYVGAGRVLFHAIDSTWRWRLDEGDIYFARYWVQTVRHLARGALAGGQGAELAASRREYELGESVELRARFFDQRLVGGRDEVTVISSSASQPNRRISLVRNPAAAAVYEATLTDLPLGEYEFVLAEPQVPGDPPAARASIVTPPGEFARTAMDLEALTAAAQISRGKFYTLAGAGSLLEELPRGRPVPIETLPPVTLWNQWWLLAALLACLTTEWILRKRKGML